MAHPVKGYEVKRFFRLVDKALRAGVRLLKIETLPKTIHGTRYRLPVEVSSILSFFYHARRLDEYEGAFYTHVLDLVRPGDTVLDIGAHYGLYTLGLSGRAGAGGRVICFEPNPYTLTVLRKTVQANHLPNVTLEPKALGSAPGQADLWVRGSSSSSSLHRFEVWGRGDLEKVSCEVTTLDAYTAAAGIAPDVLKMDVEGFEWDVLQGAAQTLQAHSARICCELHPERLAAQGHSDQAVIDLLAEWGYRVVDRFERHAGEPGRPYNVIFERAAHV